MSIEGWMDDVDQEEKVNLVVRPVEVATNFVHTARSYFTLKQAGLSYQYDSEASIDILFEVIRLANCLTLFYHYTYSGL